MLGLHVVGSLLEVQMDTTQANAQLGMLNTSFDRTLDKTKKAVNSYGYMYLALKRIATYTAIFGFFHKMVSLMGQVIELQKREAEVATLLDMRNEKVARSYERIIANIRKLPPILGSTIDLTKGLYEIMSAGVEDPNEAFKLLIVSARYAKAGLTDLATSASTLTSVMKAYGFQADMMRAKSDILFSSVMAGKFHTDELNDALGKVLPTAAAMGVSIEEVVNALAILSQSGMDANQAATGLNRMFISWLKPLEKSQRAFRQLGLQWGINAFESISFTEALQKISSGLRTNSELLPLIFTRQRGLKAAFRLTGEALDDYIDLMARSDTLTEGAGENARAAAKMNETLAEKLKAVNNSLLQNAQGWMKHTGLVAKAVEVGGSFVNTIVRQPLVLAPAMMMHRTMTTLIQKQAKASASYGDELVALRRKSGALNREQQTALWNAEIMYPKTQRQIKYLKFMRIALLGVIAAMLILNEVISAYSRKQDRLIQGLLEQSKAEVERAKKIKQTEKLVKEALGVEINLRKKARDLAFQEGDKIVQEAWANTKDITKFADVLYKMVNTTEMARNRKAALRQELTDLGRAMWKGKEYAGDFASTLVLLARETGILKDREEELRKSYDKQEKVIEARKKVYREAIMMHRDYGDIIASAAKAPREIADDYEPDKLANMLKNLDKLMSVKPGTVLHDELKLMGVNFIELAKAADKSRESISEAAANQPRWRSQEVIEGMVRELSGALDKLAPGVTKIQQMAVATDRSWGEWVAAGVDDLDTFVEKNREFLKTLVLNMDKVPDQYKDLVQRIAVELNKVPTIEIKARKKALDAVKDWATDTEKIYNDIEQMKNELRGEEHLDIINKVQEENMLQKQKLDRQYAVHQAFFGFSLQAHASYTEQIRLMDEKLSVAKQLSVKREFDTLRKAHEASIQEEYDYVFQRLAASKRFYREEELFIMNLENITSEQRKKMLLENQEYWENKIRQFEKAQTAGERYAAFMAVLGRMFGTLATQLRDMIEALGLQGSKFEEIVGVIDTVAKGFRSVKAAIDAYETASREAGKEGAKFITKLTEAASILDLVVVAITTVVSVGAKLWKVFAGKSKEEKLALEAERLKRELELMTKESQMFWSTWGDLSKGVAESIAKLRQDGVQGWLAELMLMDEIMSDIGLNSKNFTKFMMEAHKVLYAVRDGFIDAEKGGQIYGKMFEDMVQYVNDNGIVVSRQLLDMIRLTRELGIEIKEVSAYVNEQLTRAASGLGSMIEWVAKDAVTAHESIKTLTTDKRKLVKQVERLQEKMANYGVGSEQYQEAADKIKDLNKQIADLDKQLGKHQNVIDSVSNATREQLKRLGTITYGVFSSMREEGKSLFEIHESMGASIEALRKRYEALGMDVPSYLKPLFRIFKSMEKNSEFYKGMEGLMDVFAGLGNTLYLSQEMFDALTGEARNYWNLLRKTQDQGGMGLPDKDAIMMMYPMLQQAWWYATKYGMQLPNWMKDAIAKAESFGLVFEKPAVDRQIEIAEDTFDAIGVSNDFLRTVDKNIWLMKNAIVDAPSYQHGTAYSRGGFARLHPGEAVVPANLTEALGRFFTGGFGGSGGSGVVNATINLDGRQVYKGMLPILREGGAYGDIEMAGDGVY